jgi:hypothetical protein
LSTFLSAEGERFVFAEDEAGPLLFLNCGLRPEGSHTSVRCRSYFGCDSRRRKLKLNLLAMTGADLDEGVQCARSDVEADSLLKQPGYLPIRSALAAEFPDQFAVGFEF